jgi:hypothetical protein
MVPWGSLARRPVLALASERMREYELLVTWPEGTERPSPDAIDARWKAAGFESFVDGYALGKVVVRKLKEGWTVAAPFDAKEEDAKKAFALSLEVAPDLKAKVFDPQLGRELMLGEADLAAEQFRKAQLYAVEYGGAAAPDSMVFASPSGAAGGRGKVILWIIGGLFVAMFLLPKCVNVVMERAAGP